MGTPDHPYRVDAVPATVADWRDAVDDVLKGRSFERVLVGETRGGLDIQPLYPPAAATPVLSPDAQRLAHGWDIRQRHEADDPDRCRAAVLDDLRHGVTSIELGEPGRPWTVEMLHAVLDGVLLDVAPVALAPHGDLDSARALLALLDRRGEAATTRSWLGLDPVGSFTRAGAIADTHATAALAAAIADSYPGVVACTVDTTRYVDAGADEVQELGWMLATGVAMLRHLESAGLAVERAAATIGFRISADADQFLTMARVRAARSAWRSVLAACGADGASSSFHAVTSPAMFARRDAPVNMVRATSAAFGAGVGGADAVTVLPFDGSGSALARRHARNIHHLLIEEAGVHRLVDPGAGSGFVESLTARLLDAGWDGFRAVEADGGMEAALSSGAIAEAVDASWRRRRARLATRAEPVTGVSEFPDRDAATDTRGAAGEGGRFAPRRAAAPFEALRDAADRAREADRPPLVHLAALGTLADHTPRTSWISNLLAVGGIEVVGGEGEGARSPIEAAASFEAGGSSVAVICSSDAVYAERAAATATALQQAGATFVALAGNPGDRRDELAAAGVDAFLHVGIDVLAVLTELHDRLEVR